MNATIKKISSRDSSVGERIVKEAEKMITKKYCAIRENGNGRFGLIAVFASN